MLPPGNKRTKIRPPRRSLVSLVVGGGDEVDFDKYWEVLAAAISQIQSKNVSNLSYEQLYRKAYMLVLRKHGGKLYEKVSELIQTHLMKRREYILAVLHSDDAQGFLQSLLTEWNEHLQLMKFILDVLMYLNRVYVKENKKLLTNDLGIKLFKEYVLEYNNMELGDKLIQVIIQEVSRARDGEVLTTKHYVAKCVNMMEQLDETRSFYQFYFEKRYLDALVQFFTRFAQKYDPTKDSSVTGTQYVMEVSQIIAAEEERMLQILPESTHPMVVELEDNILIRDKIDTIMMLPESQQGLLYWFYPFIYNSTAVGEPLPINYEEILLLYGLVGRIDKKHELLKSRLKEYIVSQGGKIIAILRGLSSTLATGKKGAGSSPLVFAAAYINTVMRLGRQLMQIKAFENDITMNQTITEAIRDMINRKSGSKSSGQTDPTINAPELLSIFMDHHIKLLSKQKAGGSGVNSMLRSSVEAKSSSAPVELSIEDVISMSNVFLRYIKDKDAFEIHYANHFAKRFLNLKGAIAMVETRGKTGGSVGIEDFVLSKLGEELGTSLLEKVAKMNRDIKQLRDLTSQWKKSQLVRPIDLELKICNVAEWPKSMTKDYTRFSKPEDFPWPSQLKQTMSGFEAWWISGSRNDNKSLFWSPKFGSMDLLITYPLRTYEINLATYAGIVMLLFAPQLVDDAGVPVLAFDEMIELKYEEILELTKIPEADLKRQLQSIAVAPRLRLLIKSPMSKEVNDGDVFKLNDKFKAPSVKVKVLTVSASSSTSSSRGGGGGGKTKKPVRTEQDEEMEEIGNSISEGRNLEINAAIVRIMKSRQSLSHNELISELIRVLQNRFLPLTIVIKRQIEDLIEKEYLKRDANSSSLYHYVA